MTDGNGSGDYGPLINAMKGMQRVEQTAVLIEAGWLAWQLMKQRLPDAVNLRDQLSILGVPVYTRDTESIGDLEWRAVAADGSLVNSGTIRP